MIELELPGARVLFTDREQGDVREDAGRSTVERIAGRPLAYGRQVHGATVRRVVEPPAAVVEADGQATALADVAPAVFVADCLPIALGNGRVVAMLHGGWRGLAAGIVEQGVRASDASHAVIGPGARACCYEVGDDVHAVFGTSGRTLDLAAIAVERLRGAGVTEVEDTGICTICDERYFSYRREGSAAGRQAGVVWRA